MLDSAKATTMAVITNELVSNALKHGDGLVHVHCTSNSSHFAVSVTDNGPGLPDNFDMAANDRFGMRVARMMAQGIGATLSAAGANAGGASFSLVVPHMSVSA
jgi:two-component sensor histidine kinase